MLQTQFLLNSPCVCVYIESLHSTMCVNTSNTGWSYFRLKQSASSLGSYYLRTVHRLVGPPEVMVAVVSGLAAQHRAAEDDPFRCFVAKEKA